MNRILIVGAGLVGSLWAVLLKKQGYAVTVIEKRPDPRLQQVSAGRSINLIITSRGIHGLELAGLTEKVQPLTVPVYGRMMHSKTGELAYQPYGRDQSERNLSVSRADLNNFLISEAEAIGAMVQFEEQIDKIDFAKKEIQTPKSTYTYDVVFGADGAGSQVRKALCETFPNEFQEKTDWLEADYKELYLPYRTQSVHPIEKNALHIWPRGTHMMMALANRDGSFTVTLYLPKENHPWAFSNVKGSQIVEQLFSSEFPDAIPLMPNYIHDFTHNPQGVLGTVRMNRWVYQNSVALIGDAAHAIVPFFGQGMNCGFEDCTTLLNLIQSAQGNWGKALDQYNEIQRPNANAIADMALENFVEMKDKVGDAHFLLKKKVESTIEKEFSDIYRSRYGMITYTLIPYSLAQQAGQVQEQILQELIANISKPEELNLSQAKNLLNEKWVPFVKQHSLNLTRYEPKLT